MRLSELRYRPTTSEKIVVAAGIEPGTLGRGLYFALPRSVHAASQIHQDFYLRGTGGIIPPPEYRGCKY
jgi:hypothetical protein